jgi:hypothetical protein
MTAAQRVFLLVHGLLAVSLLAFIAVVARIYLDDVSAGYVSEGAKVVVSFAVVAAACILLLIAGVGLWATTGRRRYALVSDLALLVLSWWILLFPMLFLSPPFLVVAGGLTLLSPLLAIVVPGPPRPLRQSR